MKKITINNYVYLLSLPIYPTLPDEEQNFVIDTILKFIK